MNLGLLLCLLGALELEIVLARMSPQMIFSLTAVTTGVTQVLEAQLG